MAMLYYLYLSISHKFTVYPADDFMKKFVGFHDSTLEKINYEESDLYENIKKMFNIKMIERFNTILRKKPSGLFDLKVFIMF